MAHTSIKIKIKIPRSPAAMIAKGRKTAGPMPHRIKIRGGGGAKARNIQEGW